MQETVGQKLFQARFSLRQPDIEKISEELCIRPHLLTALEQDDFDKFPSACYAAGFLKIYAGYLGLDCAGILSQYKQEFQGSQQKVVLNFPEVEKNHHYLQHMVASIAIVGAVALYGVFYLTNQEDISLVALPDISDVASNILIAAQTETGATAPIQEPRAKEILLADIQEVSAPENISENTSENTSENRPDESYAFNFIQQANAASFVTGAAPDQILLSVRDDAWLRIQDGDHNILVERVVLDGEEFYMAAQPGMTLMTSNAGAISVSIGKITRLLGAPGEIRHNISLNEDDLLLKVSRLTP